MSHSELQPNTSSSAERGDDAERQLSALLCRLFFGSSPTRRTVFGEFSADSARFSVVRLPGDANERDAFLIEMSNPSGEVFAFGLREDQRALAGDDGRFYALTQDEIALVKSQARPAL